MKTAECRHMHLAAYLLEDHLGLPCRNVARAQERRDADYWYSPLPSARMLFVPLLVDCATTHCSCLANAASDRHVRVELDGQKTNCVTTQRQEIARLPCIPQETAITITCLATIIRPRQGKMCARQQVQVVACLLCLCLFISIRAFSGNRLSCFILLFLALLLLLVLDMPST